MLWLSEDGTFPYSYRISFLKLQANHANIMIRKIIRFLKNQHCETAWRKGGTHVKSSAFAVGLTGHL